MEARASCPDEEQSGDALEHHWHEDVNADERRDTSSLLCPVKRDGTSGAPWYYRIIEFQTGLGWKGP